MDAKEVLKKLIYRLHEFEEEFSVKESKLPEDLKILLQEINETDSYDIEKLIGITAHEIYEAYKNDLDRVVMKYKY